MRLKVTSIFIFNLLLALAVICQDQKVEPQKKPVKKESNFRDKLVLGGNVGANFGTRTFIQISPLIGYKIKPNLVAGIGINYNYYSDAFQKGTVYGPSVFTRYQVFEELFLHAEFQQSYSRFEVKGSDQIFNTDFPMLLLGGGYYARLGGSSRIGLTVLFDVIEDRNSFYQNPILRGGVLFGL